VKGRLLIPQKRWLCVRGVLLAALGAVALVACGPVQVPRKIVVKSPEVLREEAACLTGVAGACMQLGHRYEGGVGVAADPVKAGVLYEDGCRAGDQTSCGELGRILRLGLGVPRDEVRAADLLSVACRSGHLPACVQWGAMHELGEGVAQNYGLALRLYKAACDEKDPSGCTALGTLYADGHGIERDPALALTLISEACAADYGPACAHLGNLYETGNGPPSDLAKARGWYEKSCQLGAGSGCLLLGLLHHKGLLGDQDEAKALALFDRSCELGHATGCAYAVRLLEGPDRPPSDAARRREYRVKGCLYGQGALCHEQVEACMQAPKGSDAAPCAGEQVWRWLSRACAAAHTFSCVRVGELLEHGGQLLDHRVTLDRHNARRAYKRACRLGDKMGCQLESEMPLHEAGDAAARPAATP
jgi:TPR repeat protein